MVALGNPRSQNLAENDQVQLLRGGSIVVNLLGAFGQSLKETRLTAMLGYLLAMRPEPLVSLFGFSGTVQNVRLETRHDEGRSDIIVETSNGIGVVEAKVDATDAATQVRRYPARWRVSLTSAGANTAGTGIRHVHWIRLVERLAKAAASSSPEYRFLAKQLIAHLDEHHMVKSTESVEIYAREINEPVTLALFIQGHIYGCNYEKNQNVTRAQYFAPHFGARLSRHQPGIFHGISYVARIEKIFIAAPWNEFVDGVCAARGKLWWNSHAEIMKGLRAEKDWDWSGEQKRNFLLLGEPRLAFNPPIKKERLQSGKGWLSRRFFSFDELFSAWGR
jgi:hypothetical protein